MVAIHIKNLGPIRDLQFEIERFNLLIGEQAVGKSTICKAIYFFRLLKDNLIDYLYSVAINGISSNPQDRLPRVMNRRNKQFFIDIFGPSWDLSRNLELDCEYNENVTIRVSLSDDGYIDIKYEKGLKEFQKVEQEMDIYFKKRSQQILAKRINETLNKNFIDAEDARLYNELNRKVNVIIGDNMPTYYIPAGRSLLSLMGDLLQPSYSISNPLAISTEDKLRYNTLDFINKRFIDIVRSSRNKFSGGLSSLYNFYEKTDRFCVDVLSKYIISNFKGEYIFDDREYIKLENGQRIPINFTSSGQQEVLWLFNLLYMWLLQGEKAFVIIEEPEAHLHPALQYSVMEFIAEFANLTESTILITTHSPYILTSTNLLLYGGKLAKKDKNRVAYILGENKYINSEESNVCEIVQLDNSTLCNSLKDPEYHELLEIERLDKISDDINEKYTSLMYLEDKVE